MTPILYQNARSTFIGHDLQLHLYWTAYVGKHKDAQHLIFKKN